ncbi:MAG: hypothetical protein R2706_07450 [Acidimicrobiales bacterium]
MRWHVRTIRLDVRRSWPFVSRDADAACCKRLVATPPEKPVTILVTDKDDEIRFTGIAYGQRSSTTSLIITPLEDFLGESELASFCAWITANFDELVTEMQGERGQRTDEWIKRTEADIRAGSFAHHHVHVSSSAATSPNK